MSNQPPLPLVILISGNGSNLQAIIDAIAAKRLHAKICAVISSRANAYGLKRAAVAQIPTEVLASHDFNDRSTYDTALQQCIDHYQPGLIILAGFMRILTPELVKHYYGRLINIHPSLLPKYRGLDTHQQALIAGDALHGVTVHYVSQELDAGPIIAQATLPVLPQDTAETLRTRVHQLEHVIYPMVIQWFAENRLRLEDHHIYLDNNLLPTQGYSANIETF